MLIEHLGLGCNPQLAARRANNGNLTTSSICFNFLLALGWVVFSSAAVCVTEPVLI